MKSSRVMSSESAPPIGMVDVEPVVVPKRAGLTQAEKEQMKAFTKSAAPFMAGGLAFTFIYGLLVLSDWLDFSKIIGTTAEELSDSQSRTGFVLRYSTFGGVWVVGCLQYVAIIRNFSPAMDPTSGSEQNVQTAKNILNNSFEQFVLALVSQMILVQFLDGELTVKYIPALTLLFILGRITFALGYPKYRHFGFLVNVTPLTITMFYNLYKAFQMLF